LNWDILTDDLQRLSREEDPMSGDIMVPLTQFKQKYPILFECLEAVFGAMMSNSRLCEQVHGMMRHGLRALVGMEQSDHQRAYNMIVRDTK